MLQRKARSHGFHAAQGLGKLNIAGTVMVGRTMSYKAVPGGERPARGFTHKMSSLAI